MGYENSLVTHFGCRVKEKVAQDFHTNPQEKSALLGQFSAHAQDSGRRPFLSVSGKRWRDGLNRSPRHQNYVVCPDQPWLDGINAGDGFIRQFVAMSLGMGYTVEGQITGEETFGGIQIEVFDPKPGRFPEHPPAPRFDRAMCLMGCEDSAPMGLGAYVLC